MPAVRDTVSVVGRLDPVTEGQSQRSVMALEAQPAQLAVPGVAELLRVDSSVDIEQRGGGGVQSDVSIRGSSYEQTLVLLNGLRINDAETSHFNLDVPVPFYALDGAYVLHGAGSTLYGSDAVSGVVNLMTVKPEQRLATRWRAGLGSFGGNAEAGLVAYARGRVSEVLAGGRDFSEGFIADRDYRSEELSSETRVRSALGESDVLLATSDRAFGAFGFYGNYPSYERTKGWFAAITQQVNAKTQAALAYRRHTDEFVLYRSNPAAYENNHADTSWQGSVRRHEDAGRLRLRLDYGVEVDADQIASSNLGHHGRNRGAGYAEVQLRPGRHTSVSAGLREEVFSGGRRELVPAASVAQYVAADRLKLRAAVTRGYRLPTYTDLYYSDPATLGNAALKPESAWSYEGGADWYPGARWAVSATGFTSDQSNVIDYVRANAMAKYQAENLTHVQLSGAEASLQWRPSAGQEVRVSLTTVTGAREALQGLQSKYVFNYPSQSASVVWSAHLHGGLTLRESLRVVNRIARDTYPVVDSALSWERGYVHPYLQMTNLNDASYQEVVGVPMPGRAFMAGVEFSWARR